jgi:Fur family transcriptional regulator, ferric uptake regulator
VTDWQGMLRARGHRLTPQRQLVLEAIQELGHATPEEILAKVRETVGAVNISTVYRTLELLEKFGLVTHTHISHGPPTYHPAEQEAHLHLVCRDCENVIETDVAPAAELAARLEREYGFETDVRHLAVLGRCAGCRQKAAERTA